MTDDTKLTIGLIAVIALAVYLGVIAYRAVNDEDLG